MTAESDDLMRRIGRRRLAERLGVAERAAGLEGDGEARERLGRLADHFAAADDSDAWLILAVLTGRLPDDELLGETRRAAALLGPVRALSKAARATKRPGHRPVPVVTDLPIVVVANGPVAWSRGNFLRGRDLLVPWRGAVVIADVTSRGIPQLAAAARHARSTFVGVADGTAPLMRPSESAAYAAYLSALSWFDHVVAPTDAAADDLRGWVSMLGGIGRRGPDVLVPDELPADDASWQELVAGFGPRGARVSPGR